MRLLLRSDSHKAEATCHSYASTVTLASESIAGVHFTVLRMSFGRRMELLRRIREIAGPLQYLEASSDLQERLEANVLGQQIDDLYLRWGLVRIEGLLIDGADATAERLAECGPDDLAKEIVAAIKEQCGLSDEERKN